MIISKYQMQKLQILQNKTLRLIFSLDYETPTKVLLESCNQLGVHQIVAYQTACHVLKIKNFIYLYFCAQFIKTIFIIMAQL